MVVYGPGICMLQLWIWAATLWFGQNHSLTDYFWSPNIMENTVLRLNLSTQGTIHRKNLLHPWKLRMFEYDVLLCLLSGSPTPMFTVTFRSPLATQVHPQASVHANLNLDISIIYRFFSNYSIKSFSAVFHDLGVSTYELSTVTA